MKKVMSKLALFLSLAACLITMAIPAWAAELRNTDDKPYHFDLVPVEGFVYTEGRRKDGPSKIFTRVDSMTDDFIRVAAFSMDTSEGIPINLTYYGNGLAKWVRCKKGINYGISSVIYEYHQKLPQTYGDTAALGFQSALVNRSDTISGWWSVDSSGNHSAPIGP